MSSLKPLDLDQPLHLQAQNRLFFLLTINVPLRSRKNPTDFRPKQVRQTVLHLSGTQAMPVFKFLRDAALNFRGACD